MKELPEEKLAVYTVALIILALLTPVLSRLPRISKATIKSNENGIFLVAIPQIVYIILIILALAFLPEFIQDEIFSPGGVIVIGTLLPIYQSIVAACSLDPENETVWLQYWISSGILSYCTEFIDDIKGVFPQGGEHWYEFEFFFLIWLFLPLTNGAYWLHEFVTKPFMTPIAGQIMDKCENWAIQCLLVAVNASHLWIMWFVFLTLEEEQKRFVTVAIGTVYPTAASVVAVAGRDDDANRSGTLFNNRVESDTTFWLTYWCGYSLVFLSMDYLENFLGHIPGFYSLCLVGTVYLFLPMFNGADVVFRRILVPLSGEYENLCVRDVHTLKVKIENSLPKDSEARERVMNRAAEIFSKPKTS